MRSLACWTIWVWCWGWLLIVPAAIWAAPPNIVLIISDDHGWSDYGVMGSGHVHTPHLDRLAAQSLTFRRGYVTSSLCCPSLASIITGQYPQHHKVTSNDPPIPPGMKPGEFHRSAAFREGREVMNRHLEAVPTLPRLLGTRGYLSFQAGKWWQGHFSRGGFTHGMSKGDRHGDAGLDIGRKTMQPIFDFIGEARKQEKPFFVWYAPMLPHDPHTPPDRLLEKYRPLTPSIHLARYWAMVEWFDETCGELLTHLDQQGLAENTIVLYVADNGWTQNPDKPGFLRSKRSPYDAGLRTPLMVRWPRKIAPKMSDDLAISLDFFPTILKAAEIPIPPEGQGINLRDEAAVAARTSLKGACFTHNAVDLNDPRQNVLHRWLVTKDWKLIVPEGKELPTEVELYKIAEDPHEKHNVVAEHPEVVARFRAELDHWWNPQEPGNGKRDQ